jgi:hypothetical protein
LGQRLVLLPFEAATLAGVLAFASTLLGFSPIVTAGALARWAIAAWIALLLALPVLVWRMLRATRASP